MFFLLSKVLSFLIHPFNWFILLLLISLFIKTPKLKKRLRLSSLAIFILFSNFGLFQFVCSQWENLYSIPKLDTEQEYNIVVLGGYSSIDEDSRQISFGFGAGRIIQALPLAKLNPKNKLILSGGGANIYFDETPESDYMAPFIQSIGFDSTQVRIENKSRNTHENALYCAQLLNATGENSIVLVTSSFHMLRAKACFEKQGLKVLPYPTNPLRSLTTLKPTDYFFPSLHALNMWPILIKEWVGIIAYKLKGYI